MAFLIGGPCCMAQRTIRLPEPLFEEIEPDKPISSTMDIQPQAFRRDSNSSAPEFLGCDSKIEGLSIAQHECCNSY